MDALAWACEFCTYVHEGSSAEYLACAVCGQQRQSLTNRDFKRATKSESNGSASSKRPRTIGDLHRLPSSPVKIRCGIAREVAVADAEVNMRVLNVMLMGSAQVSRHGPVMFERKFLPDGLADRLLRVLLETSGDWQRGTWTVHGKTHTISRTTCNFLLGSSRGNEYGVLAFEDLEHVDRPRSTPPEIEEAAEYVRSYVNARVNRDWQPSFAFANRYKGGGEGVAYHSDFLLSLGPRPIIVGLSLGAQREFRLRSNDDSNENVTTISLPTPHNSIIVMKADAQEFWQHGVLKCADSSISRHPVARDVRFSLTFRMDRPDFARACKANCRCNRPATLKCSKAGTYYLCCNPAGGTASQKCAFWQKCPRAQQEAKRLRDLDRLADEIGAPSSLH